MSQPRFCAYMATIVATHEASVAASSSWGAGPRSEPPRRSGSSVTIVWRRLTSTSCSRLSPTRRAVAVMLITGPRFLCCGESCLERRRFRGGAHPPQLPEAIRGGYLYNSSSKQRYSCATVPGMDTVTNVPHPLPAPLVELIAERFRVLGEPMRIRLLDALREAPATVQELQQATGASQQNVSKHLGMLLRSGMVSRRKEGNFSLYAIADEGVFDLCEQVCGGMRRQLDDLDAVLQGGLSR